MQKAIEVTNLCKRYSQEVLKNFSLSVNEGEMVVLLGESGCGIGRLLMCGRAV